MSFAKLKSLFKAAKPELTDAEIDEALNEMGTPGGQPPTPAPIAPQPLPTQAATAPLAPSPEIAQLLAENRELKQQNADILKALGEMKSRDDAAQKAIAERAKGEREKGMKAKADEYIKAGKCAEAKRAELETDLIADTEGRLQKHYDAMPANAAVNRAATQTAKPNEKSQLTDAAATDRSNRTSAALAEIAASMPTN